MQKFHSLPLPVEVLVETLPTVVVVSLVSSDDVVNVVADNVAEPVMLEVEEGEEAVVSVDSCEAAVVVGGVPAEEDQFQSVT